MKRFPLYRQLNSMDCGPTCLMMIFKYYNKYISREAIKNIPNLGVTGISLLGLSDIATKQGFNTLSVKLTFDELINDAVLPCILFWDRYHFVVLTPNANNKKITIADPAVGLLIYSKSEFLKHWISEKEFDQEKGIVLLLEPAESFHQNKENGDTSISFSFYKQYFIKYKKQLFQLFFTFIIGSAFQLAFPILTQNIVDIGINTKNLKFIEIILIAQFTLIIGQTFSDFIRSRILLLISTRISLSILSNFWIKLMKLPMTFFLSRQAGDILQRVQDHQRLESFITGTALRTLFSIVNLFVFLIILLNYNVLIFIIFLTGSIFYLLWIQIFMERRRAFDHNRFVVASSGSSITLQLINGIQDIKLNNAEQLKRWEWETIQQDLFNLNLKSLHLTQYQQAGALFINQSKNIAITFLAAKDVLDGGITLGAMLAIQYIIGQLSSPLDQLVAFSQQAQDAKMSLERLVEIHRLEDEEPASSSYINQISQDRSIHINDLNFSYPGSDNKQVLSNLNVTFPSGKVTAIVGASGSGKTTILKLIQKFYNGYNGQIKIGNFDLKNLRPSYWRSLVGSVMQDGYIFSDTIERNIAIGEDTIDQNKLTLSCKTANIIDFIESLPLGFNTKIGVDGNMVSSGQKQRILIARSIYKNPPFILFDEATNALDAKNEKNIVENLNLFFEGRTVIIVAHRLSTVKNADKIVVIENGSLLEEGTHNNLIDKKGKYYELIRDQLSIND